MFVAKVTGSLVSTQKVDTMIGSKLLIVEPYRLEPKKREHLQTTGRTFVAIDMVGAGEGEYVLITQGSSARMTPESKHQPVDCAIIGIIDTVHIDRTCVFHREHEEA